MKLTIITQTKYVSINNIGHEILDFPEIDSNVRAIQWNGIAGEIEYNDLTHNSIIDDITPYQPFIDSWHIIHDSYVAQKKDNKPHEFVKWNDSTYDWDFDPILYKKSNKPNSYSVWDNNTNDWKVDPKLKSKYDESEKVNKKLSDNYSYLNSTDFYYVRKQETGEEIPEEVVNKRIAARIFIRENTGLTSNNS